jgi:PhnB protein
MNDTTPLAIHEVYAYLCVHDTAKAIDFYARAFGATELYRLTEPSGRIGHAEIKIGPVTVMLADEFPEHGFRGLFAQAVAAGATVLRPLQNQFYGERSGTVRDPFGHHWLLGGHIEDVTPEEMQRRYTAAFTKSS